MGSDKPLFFIIDEAQLSYEDVDFWLSCVKEQAGDTPGPNLYLALSSYGSASATVLQIPGSSPIQLKERQRVSLTVQPGWPHELALYFSLEEMQDLTKRMIDGRSFTVRTDVLNTLSLHTNSHPGLTKALLCSLFDHPVSHTVPHVPYHWNVLIIRRYRAPVLSSSLVEILRFRKLRSSSKMTTLMLPTSPKMSTLCTIFRPAFTTGFVLF